MPLTLAIGMPQQLRLSMTSLRKIVRHLPICLEFQGYPTESLLILFSGCEEVARGQPHKACGFLRGNEGANKALTYT